VALDDARAIATTTISEGKFVSFVMAPVD